MALQADIILLSLRVAILATLINLPIGTALGWLFSRKQFPMKSLLDGLVNVPLVLPPVVTGYFLLVVLGPAGVLGAPLKNWLDFEIAFTWWAAVVAGAVVSLPLLVRAVRVAVDSVDAGLEDAARLLHANEWRVFLRVTLPLARNGIIAGAVLAFGRAVGEFGATIMFAGSIPGKTQTIPLAVFHFFNQPDGERSALALVLISIVIAYASILLNEIFLKKKRDAQR